MALVQVNKAPDEHHDPENDRKQYQLKHGGNSLPVSAIIVPILIDYKEYT